MRTWERYSRERFLTGFVIGFARGYSLTVARDFGVSWERLSNREKRLLIRRMRERVLREYPRIEIELNERLENSLTAAINRRQRYKELGA